MVNLTMTMMTAMVVMVVVGAEVGYLSPRGSFQTRFEYAAAQVAQ